MLTSDLWHQLFFIKVLKINRHKKQNAFSYKYLQTFHFRLKTSPLFS